MDDKTKSDSADSSQPDPDESSQGSQTEADKTEADKAEAAEVEASQVDAVDNVPAAVADGGTADEDAEAVEAVGQGDRSEADEAQPGDAAPSSASRPPRAGSPDGHVLPDEDVRARTMRWLRRRLGRDAFEPPGLTPPAGVVTSATQDRVEAAAEDAVDDWDGEWQEPVVDEDPWTKPTVEKSGRLRFDRERTLDWVGLGAVIAICALIYVPFSGSYGLWDPWETHYGEVSRHMTETNDWISPWWGSHWHRPDGKAEGEGFYSKPILVLWAMAAGMEVWGWDEFGVRIGVVLMALLAVALTFMMGASVWNRRAGFLIALVLGTSPFFYFLARQTQTDMPFVAMMVCAMALFMMGAYGKRRRQAADSLHYALFFLTLLVCVVPQLWLIATDVGFDEIQRGMRPGLRGQSMNDFKGAKVFEEVVMAHSPRLSPAERADLAPLPRAEQEAAIEASRGSTPDFLVELSAPFFAVGLGLAAVFLLFFWGLRGHLGLRVMDTRGNRSLVGAMVILAMLSQAMALILQLKRLYDAYGMNWESGQGNAFNLIKFSGVVLAVALLVLTALFALALRHGREPRPEHADGAWLPKKTLLLGAAVVLVVFVSPAFLVLKSKALGLDGVSFWDAETYTVSRIVRVVLGSIYAPIVLGLFLALLGFQRLSRRARFWAGRDAVALWAALVLIAATIFLCVSVFYIPVTLEGQISTFGKVAGKVVAGVFQWGPVQVLLYIACVGIVAISLRTSKRKTVGQLCFLGFYIFAALATLAKGLLGFALPGAIIFFYLVATVEWKRLLEFEVPRGILVFLSVGMPWYAAMLILHENAYFQRFFVHDHFKRLASGVHQIDSGTFEHFIEWLGYGLFPWAALVPAVILRLGAGRSLLLRDDRSRAVLMLAIWAIFSFTLFSLSSTKFHHYVFPAVPPLAILVGLLLADAMANRGGKMLSIAALSAIFFVLLIGLDLYRDPQLWKNLFTYKYDREWIDLSPEFTARIFGVPTLLRGADLHRSFQETALIGTLVSAGGLALLLVRRRWARATGVVVLSLIALWLTLWGLDVYMPGISPTWSQRGVWMSYWNECTRTDAPPNADPKKIWCEESSLVYRITWRGEHYYSQNESIPLQDDADLKFFAGYNGDTPFYMMTDRSRYCLGSEKSPNFGHECKGTGSIVGEVRKHYPGKPVDHELVWDENLKFVMVKFYPAGKPPAPGAGQDQPTRIQ